MAASRLAGRLTLAASGAFMLVFLTVQLGLPLIQLMSPGAARFGWQMFSRSAPAPAYTVVLPGDRTREVDLMDYAVNGGRAEIAYDEYMPPHLCGVFPEAIEIRIGVGSTPGEITAYACP